MADAAKTKKQKLTRLTRGRGTFWGVRSLLLALLLARVPGLEQEPELGVQQLAVPADFFFSLFRRYVSLQGAYISDLAHVRSRSDAHSRREA